MEADNRSAQSKQSHNNPDNERSGAAPRAGKPLVITMPLSSIIYRCVAAIIGIALVGMSLLPWALVRVRALIYMHGEEFEIESDAIIVTISNIADYLGFLGWPPFYHNALLGVMYFPVYGGLLLILTSLLPGRLIRNIIRLAVGIIGLTCMATVGWNFAPWWPAAAAGVLIIAAFVFESHLLKGVRNADFRWTHVVCGIILAAVAVYGFVQLAGISPDNEYLRRSDILLARMALGFVFLAGAGSVFVKLIPPGVGRIYSLAAGCASVILLVMAAAVSLGRLTEFVGQYPQEVLDAGLLAVSAQLVGAKLLLFIFVYAWSAGGGAAGILTPIRHKITAEEPAE